MGHGDFVLVFLEVVEQLGQGVWRKVLARQQGHGHIQHLADVLEVLERVVRQLLVQRGRSGHAHVVDQDGVTVGLGAHNARGCQRATRAYGVLHNHRLPQGLAHGHGQQARHHVGGATRRVRHDQRDGLGGPGFGRCMQVQPQASQACNQHQGGAAAMFHRLHGLSPLLK